MREVEIGIEDAQARLAVEIALENDLLIDDDKDAIGDDGRCELSDAWAAEQEIDTAANRNKTRTRRTQMRRCCEVADLYWRPFISCSVSRL